MINLFPYEDSYYGYSPYDRRTQMELQRRRAIEAERRRRAAEEEERRRALYHQAMLGQQRRVEELERRRAEEERRRRILEKAEAERRRRQVELQRAEEEERWRQRQMREVRARRQPTTIVRGPDGRLYRIQLDDDSADENYARVANTTKPMGRRSNSATKGTVPVTKPTYNPSKLSDEMETESTSLEESSFYDAAEEENESMGTRFMEADSADLRSVKTPPTSNKNPRRKKPKKITIVVEDASDSELDDDDLKSCWRNRRPSPGEWMEPVEGYQ